MSFCCLAGLCKDPIQLEGRARWFEPLNTGQSGQDDAKTDVLRVHNSLTEQNDAFYPLQSRTVNWYTCGPTVYDACHMGHARAYLTFDILRRILEDYFHYNVVYQVNVTDVDDKIILRARQDYLVKEYNKEIQTQSFEEVNTFVQRSMSDLKTKLQSKLKTLQATSTTDMSAREKEKLQEAVDTAQFKLDQFQETEQAVTALVAARDASQLVTAAQDAIAAALDALKGSTVTDRSIYKAHARKWEKAYHIDMAALGVREPDVVTRVTEFVPQIVDYIQQIITHGFAYVAECGTESSPATSKSVYFDTTAFKAAGYDYRKLKPGDQVSAEEMAEGEGALATATVTTSTNSTVSEKKHPHDFALWKASKPTGEPAWDSPWGPGRPGWHIECSVMASDIFGNNLDVHGGGADLKFPHHDNELAQAEAYHQCNQWVNYFWHAGHLHIAGLKMSKSLKNFITIQQALQEHSPRQLRLMFLLQSWDKPMNYSDQTVDDAKAKERYFKNFFGACKAVLRSHDWVAQQQGWDAADRALHASLIESQERVHASLLDNFATDRALQALVDVVQECNKYLASASDESPPKSLLIKKVARYVTQILTVFGVCSGSDELGFGDGGSSGSADNREDTVAPFVQAFVDFRDTIRVVAKESGAGSRELLNACDKVRDTTLASLGVRVEDSADASVWKMDDPVVIAKEVEEKRQKQAEAAAKKRETKISRVEQDLQKAQASAVPPNDLFRLQQQDKWGSFDSETGLPLTTASGEPLSKSQQKATVKEQKNQEKAYEKLVKAAGGVDNITEYLSAMEVELQLLKDEK